MTTFDQLVQEQLTINSPVMGATQNLGKPPVGSEGGKDILEQQKRDNIRNNIILKAKNNIKLTPEEEAFAKKYDEYKTLQQKTLKQTTTQLGQLVNSFKQS